MPSITYDPVSEGVATPNLPRGQPGSFSSAPGQALEQVGHEGSRLAGDMNRIAYQQKISDGVTSIKQNIMQADEQFSTYMEQQKGEMPVNGAGYVDKFKEKFGDWYNDFVDQYQDPRLKKIAAEQAATLHNRFYNQAASWQIATNRAWRVNTFDQSIQHDANTLADDPSQYEALRKGQIDTINTLSGDLHPTDRISLTNKVNETYATAAAYGYVNKNPQQAFNFLSGTKPLDDSTVQGRIASRAPSFGVDKNVALAISSYETGGTFDPNATPPIGKDGKPLSSAKGVFQVLNTTTNDPNEQIDAGLKFIANNNRDLTRMLGRTPTPGEQYAAHMLGIGGAKALLKAPDAMPVASLVAQYDPQNAYATVNNNGLAGMTVGQAKNHFESVMATNMAKTAGYANAPATQAEAQQADMPAFFKDLRPSQREAMLTHAQALIRKDDSQEKVQLGADIKDSLAALSQGNATAVPDPSRVLRVLGPVEGPIVNKQLNGWQDYAYRFGQLKSGSRAENDYILQSAKPEPGQGFADSEERYQRLVTANDRINQLREKDPNGFGQSIGIVNNIDWSQPAAFSGPLVNRFLQSSQAASKFGVPYKGALTEQDVNILGPMIQHAPPQQAQEIFSQIHAAADSEDHYQKTVAQLAPNHPTYAVAGSLPPIGYAGVQNPAQYIFRGEKILHPDKGDKAEEGNAPNILMPEDKPGGFRDSWDKTVGPAFNSPLSSNQYLNAAISYYIGKQDPAKRSHILDTNLWKEAVNVVAPSVDWNNSKVLVPQGMYAPEFKDTISKVWPNVMQAYGLDPAEHNAASYPIRNTPDGKYAVTNGTTALYGKNGYPVVFGLDGSVPQMMQTQAEEPPAEAKLPKMRDPLQMPMKRSTR